LFDAMKDELSEDRLYKFTRKVDSVYYDHMLKHYSGFTKITDTALSPAEENKIHLQYRESFPIRRRAISVHKMKSGSMPRSLLMVC